MTFKEKLEQEHPEKVDEGFCGGCKDCPCDYHYEKKWDCKGISCKECWNRETPAPMTAEEAWELAKMVCYYMQSMPYGKLSDIFGVEISSNSEILMELSPYEAKAKIDEWGRKQIQVGDVVSVNGGLDYFLVTYVSKDNHLFGIASNGDTYTGIYFESCTKTGKHIDIQSILEQIGKEE